MNVAAGLGSREQSRRRAQELSLACEASGFELQIAEGPDSEEALFEFVLAAVAEIEPALLIAPSPHDLHPRHELVGRVAVSACEHVRSRFVVPQRLWLWGLWADLEFPTLLVGFEEERLAEILRCLEAHRGELERNDYRRLVRGRAEMNASLGPERVFGFGTAAPSLGYVELLTEVELAEGTWRLGTRRWLDPQDPFGTAPCLTTQRAFARSRALTASVGPPRTAPRSIEDWLHSRRTEP